MEERRICRKCLIRDMSDQKAVFQNLYAYIENLDQDIKAEDGLYESRLSACRSCDRLFQGMCRMCGCYVELRAAVAARGCPMGKW